MHEGAPLTIDEAERLASLLQLDVLDSAPEQEFDDIVTLANAICGTPIALISLVDNKRQWFKARTGLDVQETHRDYAFCAHAILEKDDMLIVNDATKDSRFSESPLVLGEPNIRFYAGAPIINVDGQPLGTVCVIDTLARSLTQNQYDALTALARQCAALFQLRKINLQDKKLYKELNDKVIVALSNNDDASRKLQQNERLNSLGHLVSGIVHDFNNILNVITIGFTLIQNKLDKPDQINTLAKSGLVAANKGAKLVAQLLKLSSDSLPDSAPICVDSQMNELDDILRKAAGSGVSIDMTLDAKGSAVFCSEIQFSSAIINLVVNARDALNGMGNIWIRTAIENIEKIADISDGKYIVVKIKDNGPGISPEIAQKIFEPFFSTKSADKGTGLGLAQVYSFALSASGMVKVMSEEGKGTSIILYLKAI
ncbi:MAG: GAF domain-containing sensor histidine kinase [Gammaproteobacteria bacterium]|nr:MAG: GAF domain-containing sensor histidine kinase [Gammaproteobacteria bacterium]